MNELDVNKDGVVVFKEFLRPTSNKCGLHAEDDFQNVPLRTHCEQARGVRRWRRYAEERVIAEAAYMDQVVLADPLHAAFCVLRSEMIASANRPSSTWTQTKTTRFRSTSSTRR